MKRREVSETDGEEAARPVKSRVRLNLEQKYRVYGHYLRHPDIAVSDLAEWAVSELNLSLKPSESALKVLIKGPETWEEEKEKSRERTRSQHLPPTKPTKKQAREWTEFVCANIDLDPEELMRMGKDKFEWLRNLQEAKSAQKEEVVEAKTYRTTAPVHPDYIDGILRPLEPLTDVQTRELQRYFIKNPHLSPEELVIWARRTFDLSSKAKSAAAKPVRVSVLKRAKTEPIQDKPNSFIKIPKRVHQLTLADKRQIYAYAKEHPEMALANISFWARKHFKLDKTPSESLIRRIILQPPPEHVVAANPDAKQVRGHTEYFAIEERLLEWLDQNTAIESRIYKADVIRSKAESIREELLTHDMDDAARAKLQGLKLSKSWLNYFMQRNNIRASAPFPSSVLSSPSAQKPAAQPSHVIL